MEYHRENPFYSKIVERYPLSKEGSKKGSFHVVLDLQGSGLDYEVGDCVGIFPVNGDRLVARTLEAMHATGEEVVLHHRSGLSYPLNHFLREKSNLCDFSRKFVQELALRQIDPSKQDYLTKVLDDKLLFKQFQLDHEVWDMLQKFPVYPFSIQEICDLLMPLLPRLYSIASSKHVVGDQLHLTITLVKYETGGEERHGVCTHHLSDAEEVPIYIQPHKGFTLPESDDAPIIMIGPGTGVAPFRGFLQERARRKATKNWLFFGEWNRAFDFFYEEFWNELVDKGLLELHVAFSRDQAEKVYVQHLMLEQGAKLFEWLEEGAYLYVCGDAQSMAKDVDHTLHELITRFGKMDETSAREYVKQLRHEKRYLRDVY